jgi:hypothetical protein
VLGNTMSFLGIREWGWGLAALSVAALMSGCVPRAVHQNMVPTDVPRTTQHQSSVSIRVESDDVQLSTLPVQEFRAAIKSAMIASGIFRRVESGAAGKYEIVVRVTSLDVPAAFAWDIQVRLVANWELWRSETKAAIWKDVIATKYVTTTKDAWGGLTRTKLSTEGAARENIREALEQIGRLKLE